MKSILIGVVFLNSLVAFAGSVPEAVQKASNELIRDGVVVTASPLDKDHSVVTILMKQMVRVDEFTFDTVLVEVSKFTVDALYVCDETLERTKFEQVRAVIKPSKSHGPCDGDYVIDVLVNSSPNAPTGPVWTTAKVVTANRDGTTIEVCVE